MIGENEHMDEFETFLKETAEQFRMIPHKRVWNSIYNNSHPARVWPSLNSLLIFICCYILIGNTNRIEKSNSLTVNMDVEHGSMKTNMNVKNKARFTAANQLKVSHYKEIKKGTRKDLNLNEKDDCHAQNSLGIKFKAPDQNENTFEQNILKTTIVKNPPSQHVMAHINFDELKNVSADAGKFAINTVNENESSFSYQVYASSSFGYGNMMPSSDPVQHRETVFSSRSSANEKYQFERTPAMNIEAGGAFLFDISKLFRLKAGMQFNYYNNKMKSLTNDDLNVRIIENSDMFAEIKDLNTANGLTNHDVSNQNKKSLNRRSYQISLPLGTEVELAGNETLQWCAGATIQPSFMLSEHSLLSSSEMQTEPEINGIMRRWNINTSVETFISFKLKNGSTINAGPQIRYQILPTYGNIYLSNEKPYNIGLKFGISRNL